MNINKIKGFTVIELMIVVGVIGILLAVGLPGLQDTISRMATNSQAKSLVALMHFTDACSSSVLGGLTTPDNIDSGFQSSEVGEMCSSQSVCSG